MHSNLTIAEATVKAPTLNLATPFAWHGLITRWAPEPELAEGQNGEFFAYTLDEPTLEIVEHDVEVERWEPQRIALDAAIDQMLAEGAATHEAAEREMLLAELAAINAPDPEPVALEPVTGFAVEFTRDGRYARGSCEGCQHVISGTVAQVTPAMESHALTHAKKATKAAKEVREAKAKLRCAEHGVFAREADGKCKRCDEAEVAPEPTLQEQVAERVKAALKDYAGGGKQPANAGEMLTAVMSTILANRAAQAPEPVVTQEVRPDVPAKLTLGIRGKGLLARRSAHELAPYVSATQSELAKMSAEEVRALVASAGIEVDWVPASQL